MEQTKEQVDRMMELANKDANELSDRIYKAIDGWHRFIGKRRHALPGWMRSMRYLALRVVIQRERDWLLSQNQGVRLVEQLDGWEIE